MGTKLYVGNLDYNLQEYELHQAFGAYGTIVEVKILVDRETGRSRGFGFITFADADEAQAALALDGTDLGGRSLRVDKAGERGPARPRPEPRERTTVASDHGAGGQRTPKRRRLAYHQEQS